MLGNIELPSNEFCYDRDVYQHLFSKSKLQGAMKSRSFQHVHLLELNWMF